MKLFRHGPLGSEAAGAVDTRGVERDISLLIPDISPDWLAPEKLIALSAIDLQMMPRVPDGLASERRSAARVSSLRSGSITETAAELGHGRPTDPLVFNRR